MEPNQTPTRTTPRKRHNNPTHTYTPSHIKYVNAHTSHIHRAMFSVVCGHKQMPGMWYLFIWCYTEKATEARHRLERQYNACANHKKQCRPDETKPYSNATCTHPRKRQNDPTTGHTPNCMKATHTRRTYTGTRPHAPGIQAGDHPVPAHRERPTGTQRYRGKDLPRDPAAQGYGQVAHGVLIFSSGISYNTVIPHRITQ